MNPDYQKQIDELRNEFNLLRANSTIPLDVAESFNVRLGTQILARLVATLPLGFSDAPLTAITAPTGGATVDSQARTAINSIITALETLGLVDPN